MKDNPLAVGARMICDALDKDLGPGWREDLAGGHPETCPVTGGVRWVGDAPTPGPGPSERFSLGHPPRRLEGPVADAWYWRDVLGNMEDLLIDWQCQPCGCKADTTGPLDPYRYKVNMCKRCKVVRLCSEFKSTVEGS